MKKVNYLGFMSVLALLGILGVVTANKGYFGFFGFLYYVRYFWVIPDEMFRQSVLKSASMGFFAGMAATAAAVALFFMIKEVLSPVVPFACGFVVSVFAFTIGLFYFQARESRG